MEAMECKSLQNIDIEDYGLGKCYRVDVTCINNPHSFYVRSINYCTYLKTLERCGKTIQTSDLLPGSTVVYRSQICNKYVRGNIVGLNKTDGQTFQVLAIDYGHLDKSVDIKEIFMSETSVNVPPLAKHCQLANCEPLDGTFTDDVKEAMETYINNECCLMIVKAFNGDKMIVQLNNSCPDDIATTLAMTHFTSFGFGMNIISASRMKFTEPATLKFCMKNLKVNDVVHIRILRAKSLYPKTYYVAVVDDYKNYMKNRNSFTEYCRNQRVLPIECFEIGKPVAYKLQFDIHYERAVIKSIVVSGFKALIFLIDRGDTIEAVLDQMKEIQSLQYFKYPGIAFQCTFKETVEVASKLPQNIIPGYEAWIKIIAIGDPNIVEKISTPDNFQC